MGTAAEARALAALTSAGMEEARLQARADGHFDATGQIWVALQLKALGDEPLWLRLPTTARATAKAGPVDVHIDAPGAEVLEEGRTFAESLLAHGQVLMPDVPAPVRRGPRPPSHELVRDAAGRLCLRRRGFD